MLWDKNKDGIIQDSELLSAIQAWLRGEIGDEELLKVIQKWLNPEFEVPKDWKPREVSYSEIYRKYGIHRIYRMDDRYITVRPEILLNKLIGVEMDEFDDMTAALVAMGIWHLDRETAKTACFLALYNGRWYNACFDGKKLWVIDARERKFWELKCPDDAWLCG